MKRRKFLALLGFSTSGILFPSASCQVEQQNKVNFLFILADDLGWSQIGCYGSKYYETPNIDKLSQQGMRFTDAYAACPVCSPTRASIITGKYPARLHLTDFIAGNPYPYATLKQPEWQKFLPLEEITIAEILKEAGYQTASFGKWHLSIEKKPPASLPFNPDKQGFDQHIITYKPTRDQDPENDAHNVKKITEESLQFMEKNTDRPFFLYVTHNSIHDPLKEKGSLIEKYKNKAGADLPENNPIIGAMLERLDTSIGLLLNKLETLKIADRTMVIFFSDNGGLKRDAMQTPLRGGKAQLYEGGIRVPLLVRWPGVIRPGSSCRIPVSSVDFLPTLCDIIGQTANIPEQIDGESILPLLKESGNLKRNALFWHYPHYHSAGIVPSSAIRNGQYKLIEWLDTSFPETVHRYELYDLENDVSETKNLVDDKPTIFTNLKDELTRWRKSVQAQMLEPNPNYNPEKASKSR